MTTNDSSNFKNIGPLLKKVQTKLNNLPKEAHTKFVAITPIDKGRARRSTKLTGKKH